MDAPAHELRRLSSDRTEIEVIPPERANEKPRRRIYKCSLEGLGELGTSNPRFGPYYCENDCFGSHKEDAWQHILTKSPDDEAVTTEIYTSAMGRVKSKARETYVDGAFDSLSEDWFLWMMIKDGCFLLQLALFILGAFKALGYTDDHPTFGRKQNDKKNIHGWIESMFFVGNQIPLVVLNELMKQAFFQNVIADYGKWEKPSESDMLSKQVLYELLILPALEHHRQNSSRTLKRALGWASRATSGGYWLPEQPSDLLHGLQCLVIGPGGSKKDFYDDKLVDIDLETRNTIKADIEKIRSPERQISATELRKAGILFKKLKRSKGSNGIYFRSVLIFTLLYLPKLALNDDTETIFKNLKYYEICQHEEGVRFYLFLMSCLITSYQDVNVLASSGIIEARSPYHKYKLLRMLRNLDSGDISGHNCDILLRVKDYPVVKNYFTVGIAIMGLYLTSIQTLIALPQKN